MCVYLSSTSPPASSRAALTCSASDLETFSGMDLDAWQSCNVTIPAGTKFVRFVGSYVSIDNIYGSKLDETPRPKLEVEGIANGGSLKYNLWRYISTYKTTFPEDIIQYLMRQIVDAIKYLHFNKIIHRDLKLDNILLNFPSEKDKQNLNLKSCQIKIIDFGFAKVLNNKFTFTALGTPFYMDPKILENVKTGIQNSGYDEKVDIWSLGTLCYEMIVGHGPFMGNTMDELYQKVKNGNYTLPITLSEELVSFINDMLQQDSKKRANASDLMNHPFLVNPINSFHHIDVKKIQANCLPGGMINMTSKQPEMNIENDSINIWSIFNEPRLYQGPKSVQIQKQNQNQIQPLQRNLSEFNNNFNAFQNNNQQQIYYNDQPQNQFERLLFLVHKE